MGGRLLNFFMSKNKINLSLPTISKNIYAVNCMVFLSLTSKKYIQSTARYFFIFKFSVCTLKIKSSYILFIQNLMYCKTLVINKQTVNTHTYFFYCVIHINISHKYIFLVINKYLTLIVSEFCFFSGNFNCYIHKNSFPKNTFPIYPKSPISPKSRTIEIKREFGLYQADLAAYAEIP